MMLATVAYFAGGLTVIVKGARWHRREIARIRAFEREVQR